MTVTSTMIKSQLRHGLVSAQRVGDQLRWIDGEIWEKVPEFETMTFKENEVFSYGGSADKVLRAWYGKPGDQNRHVWKNDEKGKDVTGQVRQLLATIGRFTVSNDHFGDPAPRRLKVMHVEIEKTNVKMPTKSILDLTLGVTISALENTVFDPSVHGNRGDVIHAWYGKQEEPSQQKKAMKSRGLDVTEKVKELLEKEGKFMVSNTHFADPAPGQIKVLIIQYAQGEPEALAAPYLGQYFSLQERAMVKQIEAINSGNQTEYERACAKRAALAPQLQDMVRLAVIHHDLNSDGLLEPGEINTFLDHFVERFVAFECKVHGADESVQSAGAQAYTNYISNQAAMHEAAFKFLDPKGSGGVSLTNIVAALTPNTENYAEFQGILGIQNLN